MTLRFWRCTACSPEVVLCRVIFFSCGRSVSIFECEEVLHEYVRI